MIPIKPARSLTVYTLAHLCVDFACFYMLFGNFMPRMPDMAAATVGFLTYNAIAFGMQPIVGYIADIKRRIPIASIGCGLLIAGYALFPVAWVSLIVCALGNACFHVGGGADSLDHAQGRMTRSGIFVSSGALGVALGALTGKLGISVLLPIGQIGLSLVLVVIIEVTQRPDENPTTAFRDIARPGLDMPVVALCFASIVIRSYVGSIFPITWNTSGFLLLLPALGAAAGKALGGVLADRLGARVVGVASLTASTLLLCFGYASPALCALGIVCFNMSMSITLCAIAQKLPGARGFAFGLTTFGLLLGNLPTYFIAPGPLTTPLMGVLTLLSASCILFAMAKRRGGSFHEHHRGIPEQLAP